MTLRNVVKPAESEVALGDVHGRQGLPLPEFTPVTDRTHTRRLLKSHYGDIPDYMVAADYVGEPIYLALEILRVYPGSVYQDSVISEVRGR